MDTTSLGINQGCEELFIGWIIVIIGLIVIFFLSKMNKKEKKSTDVDLSPTQKPLNGNDNKTLIFTTNSMVRVHLIINPKLLPQRQV